MKYIDAEDTNWCGAVVDIMAVDDGGERLIVTMDIGGETVKYGFKTGEVEARDRNLVAMRNYLAAGGPPIKTMLEPVGRGVTFKAV
jgi:hypothetical protein